ncbi:MAG: endo-1,4-beta-xylanase [Candidatus Solibacter usitatus]|nr:endo-1,4-beta-xylanase [Candidatus Solibacter usitatus]
MRFLAVLAGVTCGLWGQSPTQPVPLIAGDPLQALRLTLGSGPGRATAERVAAEGAGFNEALKLTTTALPANEWDIRVRALGAAAVKKDDAVLATFWLKCVEPADGECVIRLNVERRDSPYTKSYSQPVLAGPEWKQFKIYFQMAEDYAPGGYYVDFWFSQQRQVALLGGITVDDYGQGVKGVDLGLDPLYEGAAADAPWRAAAEERIEKLRKGELVVEVVDAEGNPVPGAQVRARMTRHAFGWGTAIAADLLLGERRSASASDVENYRRLLLENFNMVVFENDLKWPPWEANRARALSGIQWMLDHGITKIRGHNLVWPNWQYLPKDLAELQSDPEALRKRVLDHIQDEVTATRGSVQEWDVLNEPYTNKALQKILGDAEMAAWFKKAREYDPGVALFINDYSILSANGADIAHRNGYYEIIRYLGELEAPVDGIGMQGHFGSPTPPEVMLRILDRFAQLGKPIEITEFDFNTKDERLQAAFTRDLLTTAFSHPAVTNFLMWGFWEGSHWLPQGAMVRRDWSAKPNFEAWREMVYGRWWTDEKGAAGEDGVYRVRGFQGDYEIEAALGERVGKATVSIGAAGTSVKVVLN